MTIKPRLLPVMGAALLSISVAGAVGAKEAAKVQLPDQVLTDAAAKAAPAPAAAARSAAARTATSEPSAAELEAKLMHMTSESSDGLVSTKTASGGQRIDLDERFMSVMVAVPTAGGHVEANCVTGDHALHTVHEAQKMSAGELPTKKPAATPAKLEEK
jgi:hypothetical protein